MEGMNTPQNHFETEIDESEKVVRKILSEIDESSIKHLLQEQLESVGSGELISRFVPTEDIKVTSEASNTYGSYVYGEIEINPYMFAINAERAAITITEDLAFKMRSRGWHLHEGAGKSSGNTYLDALLQLINKEYLDTVTEMKSLHQEANEIEFSGAFQKEVKRVVMHIKVTHTLFHEQLHALSDKNNSAINHDDFLVEKGGFTAFHTVQVQDGVRYRKTGAGLDEGMTQVISLQIAKKYIEQHPPDGVSQEIINYVLQETRVGYTREMHITETIAAIIAVISGQSDEEVMQSLFQRYVNNEEPLPDNFAELLAASAPFYQAKGDSESYSYRFTEILREILTQNSFDSRNEFYIAVQQILRELPEDKQEELSLKLKALNEKYFDPLEE